MGRPLGRPPLGDKAMTGVERLRRWRERRRQTTPETKERELQRLRRENETLRRKNETLKRVNETVKGGWGNYPTALEREIERLKRQLFNAQAANPGVGPGEERAAGKLQREIDRLKQASQREIARLKEELNLARDSALRKRLAGDDAPKSISKHDWRAIQRCLHPDGHPTERQRTEASQVFNALKINVT